MIIDTEEMGHIQIMPGREMRQRGEEEEIANGKILKMKNELNARHAQIELNRNYIIFILNKLRLGSSSSLRSFFKGNQTVRLAPPTFEL